MKRASGFAALVVVCGLCAAMAAGCGGGGDTTDNGQDGDVATDQGAIDAGDISTPDVDDARDAKVPVDNGNDSSLPTDAHAPDGFVPDVPNDIVTHDKMSTDENTPDGDDEPVATDTVGPDVSGDQLSTDLGGPDEGGSDAVGQDTVVTDTGCVPDCSGQQCGLDPICGKPCGTCTGDGIYCIAGACANPGCYRPLEGACFDTVVPAGGSGLDLDALAAACEADNGIWEVCPVPSRLLDAQFNEPEGGSFVLHYYFGLLCDADEARADAQARAARETGDTVTFLWADETAQCTADIAEKVACVDYDDADHCLEMAGGLSGERADAFAIACISTLGGTIVDGCPDQETGSCEIAVATDAGVYMQEMTYESGDVQSSDLLAADDAACADRGGLWLPTNCASQDVPYNECTLDVRSCIYPAGNFRPARYGAAVGVDIAEYQASACCFDAPDAPFNAAFDDLAAHVSLNQCLPCTPDCDGLECGPDFVCGKSCGTCVADAQSCVSGQCEASGCNLTAEDICMTNFTATTGQVDWASKRADCEGSGGTWEPCPTTGMLLAVRLADSVTTHVDIQAYTGRFCTADEAAAYLAQSLPLGGYNEVFRATAPGCGTNMVPSIACWIVDENWCNAMSGSIAIERSDAFEEYCVSVMGGVVRKECPWSELGLCENTVSWAPTVDSLSFYYTEDAALEGANQCEDNGGLWLATQCVDGNETYGTCSLPYTTCQHPAGATQSEYFETWLYTPSGADWVFVSGDPTFAASHTAALSALQSEYDLSACE